MEWLRGALGQSGKDKAGDRGAARAPAPARAPRRVRIQEDATAAAAARERAKDKARKDKKDKDAAPVSRLKDDFVVDKKVLGEGHYGVVRRCSPKADPAATFAVKTITKSRVTRPEMLRREVEILKTVKHANIVEIVAVYDEPHYLHIVSELCTGGELFERIIQKSSSKEKHFNEEDAAHMLKEILGAVAYCHGLEPPVVHRDLKPENFLFKSPGESPIKIIDFGLSRADNDEATSMHTRVGTPYYIAPEVLKRDYTLKCDVWSVGVIAYILLCGYPPFYGDNDWQIFRRVSAGKFSFPSPEWDHISREARDFVKRLLAMDPQQRPSAAEALTHAWIRTHARDDAADAPAPTRAAAAAAVDDPQVLGAVARRMARFVAMGKLKRLALNVLAQELSGPELTQLRDVFREIDSDNSGTISTAELRRALAPHVAHRADSGG